MKITFRSLITNYWILFVLMALKMVLQLIVVNPVYELHRDEFLHLDQANHLAAGYISVPPLTSWVSFVIKLLGDGVFWVRFFPALFGAITLIMVWMIVEQLKGGFLSKILVSTVFIFSVFARMNILYQPNSFDILAWTCVFYFLIRFINEDRPVLLFFMMIFLVLGFYNKYNIIFFLAGIFVSSLITDLRKVFINRYFYLALTVGLILLIPNLLWQNHHQFPVIQHMRVLKETQLNHVERIGLLAFGTVFMEKFFTQKFKIIGPLYIVLNLLFLIAVARFMLLILSPAEITKQKQQFETLGLLRWEDGKNHQLPQDFADMLGWKEMAAKALSAYNTLSDSAKDGFVDKFRMEMNR